MRVLGVDIGGTGIKGAVVDTRTGRLLTRRHRIATPHPSTPAAIADVVVQLVRHFSWRGPIGITLPSVVRARRVRTAANISHRWLGVDAYELFATATARRVSVINDADAAGYAEMHFGAGRGREGLVLMVVLGTGIGSALFINGHLVPNTELGHLRVHGHEAEKWVAESVRVAKGLGWKKWSSRLNTYLRLLHAYFWPDLVIIGGGVSRKWRKFGPRLELPVRVVAARLRNEAGIVGAALAYEHEQHRARQKKSLD